MLHRTWHKDSDVHHVRTVQSRTERSQNPWESWGPRKERKTMRIEPVTIIQVKNVTLGSESSAEDVLAILPGLHNNPYLTESSKSLLMALAGAAFARTGTITANNEDLWQISMYVDMLPDRVVVKL